MSLKTAVLGISAYRRGAPLGERLAKTDDSGFILSSRVLVAAHRPPTGEAAPRSQVAFEHKSTPLEAPLPTPKLPIAIDWAPPWPSGIVCAESPDAKIAF